MANFYLDICLSDIPKERIKTAKNGKKYLKAIINPRRQPDSDGYDHYIAAFVPKEERIVGEGPAFIGRAQDKNAQRERREQFYGNGQQQAQAGAAQEETDDLPF